MLAVSASGAVVQQAILKPSVEGTNDGFGRAIAISGNTLVIGAPFESSDATGVNGDPNNDNAPEAGAAYIFVREGTNWLQQAFLKGAVTWPGDRFGSSVAIFDNTVVIGVPRDSSTAVGVNGAPETNDDVNTLESGAAYVFVRNGTNWTQQAYLKPDNLYGTSRHAWFGHSVGITRDTIVVGAPRFNTFSGVSFFYARTGTNWIQQTNIYFQGLPLYSGFGFSVAASGDTIIVSDNGNDNHAFPFVRNGTNWTRQGTEYPSLYGTSAAISGDTAVLGGGGSANAFFRNGGDWNQRSQLAPTNAIPYGQFGDPVSISENTIIVGSPLRSTGVNIPLYGSAYIFTRHGTNWSQQDILFATDRHYEDRFGIAVSVSGQTAAVGADGLLEELVRRPGTAYVFTGVGVGPTVSVSSASNGALHLRISAIGDLTYRLERAPSVSGPWTTNATLTALTTGAFEFHDTNASPGQAFYRVAQQ